MSVQKVHALIVQCDGWHRIEGHENGGRLCPSRVGPFFYARESDVPIPTGWGYRTDYDCGLTGYTKTSLYCPECVKRFGIVLDGARQ